MIATLNKERYEQCSKPEKGFLSRYCCCRSAVHRAAGCLTAGYRQRLRGT
ncbi:hypothetical protein bb8_p52 [Bordetella phage vB_BbrP_BB8]|uniref:Uncharacterized protein n=1 Tax=Bordetella phage vB_BbrP_BB8 TaxID=2587820 RepID=A0A4Y5TNT6_9CAUD|nr:hypothetical protein bb8_p52 [Bordetella phage vB_BbrP_BB8]